MLLRQPGNPETFRFFRQIRAIFLKNPIELNQCPEAGIRKIRHRTTDRSRTGLKGEKMKRFISKSPFLKISADRKDWNIPLLEGSADRKSPETGGVFGQNTPVFRLWLQRVGHRGLCMNLSCVKQRHPGVRRIHQKSDFRASHDNAIRTVLNQTFHNFKILLF